MGSPSQSFTSTTFAVSAVNGENTAGGIGISGISMNGNPTGGQPGVQGVSDFGPGVLGQSTTNHAVHGESSAGRGVVGKSQTFVGVTGESKSSDGVLGVSETGIGVHAKGTPAGFFEGNIRVNGTVAVNAQDALHLVGFEPFLTLVDNENNSIASAGIQNIKGDLFFFSDESRKNGTSQLRVHNEGHVTISGNLNAKDISLVGADCAENFDVVDAYSIEPGTVMVLGHEGALEESQYAYDKKVAGVVSGAGLFSPGIVMDKGESMAERLPIALLGKTYCKVDASSGPIAIGDLLTTSATPGHAMRATDSALSFGAVIGKALKSVSEGRALIPILIALQ